MKSARRCTLLVLALTLFGTVACNEDQATGPTAEPSLAIAAGAPGTYAVTERQLKEWELREKSRVAAEQEASKSAYNLLKAEWDRVLKRYPTGNTGAGGPVYCDPLAYTADVKIIGPEGGDMSVGPHKLSIPRGALKHRVVITGEMPVSMAVTVRLSPHGLVFAKQPKLTLSYKHCMRPTQFRERVAYTTEGLQAIEFPVSRDYTEYGLVEALLSHFSRYAVWY